MNIFVFISIRHLPLLSEIISLMYFKGADYSWVGNDDDLRFGEGVQICWNKWVDDKRWKGRDEGTVYLSVEFKNKSVLHLFSEEELPLVDKRAIVVFVKHLLEIDDKNLWSFDQSNWRSKTDFMSEFKEILSYSFESAVEQSLK
jgi:hypothetical protein